MSELDFHKMQAQGNDFIILDQRKALKLPQSAEHYQRLADRRLGIGCDQILVLASHPSADVSMRIFNADGSEAENCGNGLRCVAWHLAQQQQQDHIRIALRDRIIDAQVSQQEVCIHMGAAKIISSTSSYCDVSIGNPHRVYFELTEKLNHHDRNIEMISGEIGDHIYIDLIERGSGHTPACGSGACATAAAIWHRDQRTTELLIIMPGGQVRVSGSIDAMRLTGNVALSFRGSIATSMFT